MCSALLCSVVFRVCLQVLPTDEEETAIAEFGGDKSKLAKPDGIVMALYQVAGCKHRVHSYLFSLRFPPRLEALRAVCTQTQHSTTQHSIA